MSTESFKQMFRRLHRQQAAQKRKAGKHTCVWKPAGTISQVTRSTGKALKRAKVLARLYECSLCGEVKTEKAK